MLHDEQFLGQIEGVLIVAMDDREDALRHGKVITKACREYGEVIAAPLEARILALEEPNWAFATISVSCFLYCAIYDYNN